ncbi:MAG: LptF/LptG family permease, partial [Chthoniobacteraceae bacterium]
GILDRYVLRSFFEPFLLCFFGFLAIWLTFDLSDHLSDFIEGKAPLSVVAGFYFTQLPQFVMISLPVGLLLALLFALSKMSRSNEIISMQTAGRSVFRIIGPLVLIGLFLSGILVGLNYELAPHAEGTQKIALEQIREGDKKPGKQKIEAHLFRDRQTRRTWYVKKLREDMVLDDVHITQEDEHGNITRKWYANRASWDPDSTDWVLFRGLIVDFDAEGNVTKTDSFPETIRVIKGWTETPRRIASSTFDPEFLSVPELRDYLVVNNDFPDAQLAPFRTYLHHRLAVPWTCLVVVLIAAPLGIVYNRRGVLAGVASSIFIFFGMIFLTNLCLALGKGSRVSPMVAGWLPILVMGGIGLLLLYFRATNRDFTTLFSRRRA